MHKSDLNQKRIIDVIRKCGATVANLSGCKLAGFPDLLIGYRGQNILVEVKNPEGLNRISEVQREFAEKWRGGQVHYVRTVEEAVELLSQREKALK
jgi:hypothetical protein